MVDNEQMQEEILAQQIMAQNSNAVQDFNAVRENLLRNPSPESQYENAVFLLSDSDTFVSVPEIEKEIKLANLDPTEKVTVQTLLNSYQDIILLNDLQMQKFEAYLNKKDFNQFKREQSISKLDKLNFLRRAVSISTVSRGKDGFERKSQNTIISKSEINNDAMSTGSKVKSFFTGGGNN